jgi:hypothetical protein
MSSSDGTGGQGKRIDSPDFAADLSRRRAEMEARTGTPVPAPRNAGTRRTASKKALLKAIKDAGGTW